VDMSTRKTDYRPANTCFRCGKYLRPGGLKYRVDITITSAFNGVIDEHYEEGEMERLVEEIKQMDPEELEKEVYQELTITLCKDCRGGLIDYLSEAEEVH